MRSLHRHILLKGVGLICGATAELVDRHHGRNVLQLDLVLAIQERLELVIRATKDLEHLLETGFGAPSDKQTGLHDKITHAQNTAGLSKDTVKKLRYLVTVRNKLVHNYEFNKLDDRDHFARSYDSVEKELREKLKGKPDGACIIS